MTFPSAGRQPVSAVSVEQLRQVFALEAEGAFARQFMRTGRGDCEAWITERTNSF